MDNPIDITSLHTGSEVERDGKKLEVDFIIEDKKGTHIDLKPAEVVVPPEELIPEN